MAPKGVSNRTLLAKKKGIKMGQTIMVAYREDGKGDKKVYEGLLSDRRIGGTDRESYLVLKKCLLLGSKGEIVAMEGDKRFVDAFLDDMDITEPRSHEEITAFLSASQLAGAMGAASDSAAGSAMDMMQMAAMNPGMQAMSPGMGMMPTMGMSGMGGMPMGMNPMGMGNPMMMGMANPMSMGMNMGMAMAAMNMGMGGMGMGMGGMGGMGMNPMMAMQMRMMGGTGQVGNASGSSANGSGCNADAGSEVPGPMAVLGEEPTAAPQDVAAALEQIEDGRRVQVAYMHPRLGKTTYRGVMVDKFIGASHVQSYLDVKDCQRIGRRGNLRELEPTKRLMLAFVDEVRELPDEAADCGGGAGRRSRSRSRGREG